MAGACCKSTVCDLRCGEAGDSVDTVDVRESVKLVILGQRVFFWAIYGYYVIIF